MDPECKATSKMIKSKFPTFGHIYRYLTKEKNYFLPPCQAAKKKDRAITFDYLLGVFTGENYAPQIQNILLPPSETKAIDSRELLSKIEAISSKKFNFSSGHYPNKKWMIKVLYNLNKEDEIFKQDRVDDIELTFDDSTYKELVALPNIVCKHAGGFRITEQQKKMLDEKLLLQRESWIKKKVKKYEEVKKNKEDQISRFKKMAEEAEKAIKDLQDAHGVDLMKRENLCNNKYDQA